MKRKIVFIIISAFFCLPHGSVVAEESTDAHKPHQHRHLEYTKIENPVAKTEQSLLQGKTLYVQHCKACHGAVGKGGIGPDLTGSVRIHGSTDGELFHVITSGVAKTAMKGFGDELSTEMRWHLVNYVASLRKKEMNR
jgi:cytochrome c oxidase cbb3-type subunit 3